MKTFFLMRYVCVEPTEKVAAQGGCDCPLRLMRSEIFCSVQGEDEREAARRIGGECGGQTLTMDPDLTRFGDLNDCVLHRFRPGRDTHHLVLSVTGRYREGYADRVRVALEPYGPTSRLRPIFLVESHDAGRLPG